MNDIFVVDTNFFIQSHRERYPLDVATSFWDKVKILAGSQKIISIDKVKNEIWRKEDKIKQWCEQNLPEGFFFTTKSKEILSQYKKVIKWAISMNHQYTQKAIDEFLEYERADAWLISFALAQKKENETSLFKQKNFIIVTYETSAPESKNKIKIPDVCNRFATPCVNVVEMFRKLGETF